MCFSKDVFTTIRRAIHKPTHIQLFESPIRLCQPLQREYHWISHMSLYVSLPQNDSKSAQMGLCLSKKFTHHNSKCNSQIYTYSAIRESNSFDSTWWRIPLNIPVFRSPSEKTFSCVFVRWYIYSFSLQSVMICTCKFIVPISFVWFEIVWLCDTFVVMSRTLMSWPSRSVPRFLVFP